MSIRLIAEDLYRIQREMERLEEEKRNAREGRREDLEDCLRKARAEYQRLRRVLDGAKAPPETRRAR